MPARGEGRVSGRPDSRARECARKCLAIRNRRDTPVAGALRTGLPSDATLTGRHTERQRGR
jgi:hypothetical protein